MEPEKCAGWDWVTWKEVETCAPKVGDGNMKGKNLFEPMTALMIQRKGFNPVSALDGLLLDQKSIE